MAVDFVNKIIKTEKEADEIRRKATLNAEKQAAKATEQANELIAAAMAEREGELEKAVKEAQKEAIEELAKMRVKQTKIIRDIDSKGKKSFDKGVRMVVKEILG